MAEDYRTTGATTRFLLPHPIAALYAQVHAVPEPSLRYGYYLRLAEGIFKLLGLFHLADAMSRGAPDKEVRRWLQMIERPSMGKLLALNVSCLRYLERHGGPFLEEAVHLLDGEWDDLTRQIPEQRNYYAHRLLVVSDAEARERLPALREPVHRLLTRVQFLQSYLLGLCRRADPAGRRGEAVTWRTWWSPSRGLAELGEVSDLPTGHLWPVGVPLLIDPRRGEGLCLGPLLRWDGARGRIDWLDGLAPAGVIYRHPIAEDPIAKEPVPLPFPDPHAAEGPGLDLEGWLPRRADSCFRFPLGLTEPDREVLRRGSLTPALGERWEIRGELGRGAMGTVMEARDNVIGDRVALKLLHEHLVPSQEHRLRFLQEANLLRRLQHPGLVRVHDVVLEGPRPVLVMEHLEGEDLGAVLSSRGPLGPEAAADIVAAVLDALAYAHAHGVVHRDVKPRNVMRCADGTVKLLDFGVARATAEDGLTRSDTISRIGTDAYMAPEQRLLGQVDARSDVYGAGRLLYALVAGRDPAPHLPGLGTAPPRLEDAQPDAPPWVCAVYERATRDAPAERYGSAEEMAAALRARGGAAGADPASVPHPDPSAVGTGRPATREPPRAAGALVRRRLAMVNLAWLLGLVVVLLRYVLLTVWPDPRAVLSIPTGGAETEESRSPTAAP